MADQSEEAPAGTLKVATALIGAIFIVAIVLYGISNQRDETADAGSGAVATGTPPQPSGGQQPATPSSNASQPSEASNPSATTGQGPNPQNSPGGNAGNSKAPANAGNGSAPANASGSAQPPNKTGNQ